MKILKPGKAEQRKFVCPKCGCVFVAGQPDRHRQYMDFISHCPQAGCDYAGIQWGSGEPYEEPTTTQTDRERCDGIICDLLNRESISRKCIVEYLIANGVTFREG